MKGYVNGKVVDEVEFMEDEANGIMGGLCMECYHAEGPYWTDLCYTYNMPFTMVHRKNKCKHFRQAVY